jgi:capsule polysaccharide export protein KpsE/RkpR
MGVLRSRSVQDSVIEKFDLRKVYGVRYMQNARVTLEERTSISEDRKSGIVTIEVIDRDPKRAAGIAESYIENLNKVVTQLTTSSARREREFLEARLRTVQDDLDQAQREFSQFSSKNSTLDIKEQAKSMVEAAAVLQGQLIAAQSELSGLETIYTSNNVRVRALKARIAELQVQINKMGGNSTPYLPAKEGSDQETQFGVPSIRQLPLLGVQYADLFRRVKVQEAIFEILTKQYELAKVQEAKETPSVKVLDLPDMPEKKAGPPRLLLAILGTILAFGGCCFWIVVSTHWERLDKHDERKILLVEVGSTLRDRLRKVANSVGRLRPSSRSDLGR